jgi:hypothetical protein
MDKPVRFTLHALQKFNDLAEMGFAVTEEQVIQTVHEPDVVDRSEHPPMAQRIISENHVLRVVFIEDSEGILVVTFYPGRRTRYAEDKDAL